jgi:hypothetical protein
MSSVGRGMGCHSVELLTFVMVDHCLHFCSWGVGVTYAKAVVVDEGKVVRGEYAHEGKIEEGEEL